MSAVRKWWSQSLLVIIFSAVSLEFFGFVFFSLLPVEEEIAWLETLCMGSMIWVFVLSTSLSVIALMGFIGQFPKPNLSHSSQPTAWGIVGGLAAFLIPLSEYLWSCCYQGDMYFLVCFGPLLFLMGFGIGSRMQKATMLLIAIFLTPLIGGYLEPILGITASLLVNLSILVSAVGLAIYWRMNKR